MRSRVSRFAKSGLIAMLANIGINVCHFQRVLARLALELVHPRLVVRGVSFGAGQELRENLLQ